MSNIKESLSQAKEPIKSVGFLLIDFYENMYRLETDEDKSGKQATLIVMTINDIEDIIEKFK